MFAFLWLSMVTSLSVPSNPDMVSSPWSCLDIDHNVECQDIMMERYALSPSDYHEMMPVHQMVMADNLECVRTDKCPLHLPNVTGQEYPCIDGRVSVGVDYHGVNISYPCSNVNLLAFVPLVELGSQLNASGNDIWGYTEYDASDQAIGYYALTCQTDGVSIVDITDPIHPNVLAFVQSNVFPIRHVNWRDLKVHGDHAYVVADTTSNYDDHGLQIFNIKEIIESARKHQQRVGYRAIYNVSYGSSHYWNYTQFGGSHNIFINEETGYLYSVGTNSCGRGGLHVVDIRDPRHPQQVGCFAHADTLSYVHDAQCVNYHGPDTRYHGHEVCFCFTPRTKALTIIDVKNKTEMVLLAEVPYEFASYTHQGWVTTNHEYLLMNDEIDEVEFNLTQRTLIWNVQNLTRPVLMDIYDSNLTVIDHNEYIIDNGRASTDGYKGFVFQSNYEAGVRILNIDDIANANLYEVGFFDNYIWKDNINYTVSNEDHNNANYRGSWSVFPYFKPSRYGSEYSDIMISQNINTGLYVLRHTIGLNEIFEDDEDSEFWTNDIIITFSVIGALVLLLILAIIVIYLNKVSTKNKSGDEAQLIDHDQRDQQMTTVGGATDTYAR